MKLTDLKAGDKVTVDSGFSCMEEGVRVVHTDEDGGLYVECKDGHHYLDGQEDEEGGDLVGISPA